MSTPSEELDFIKKFRARCHSGDKVFWADQETLCVFEPNAAQKVNALNYKDLTLPDKLADVLRGRQGKAFSWKEIRTAWAAQLQHLSKAEALAQLAQRMMQLFDQQLDCKSNLVWLCQNVITQALLPAVINGLSGKEKDWVLRDQAIKLTGLAKPEAQKTGFINGLRTVIGEVRAATAVRRELKGRAKGYRARQCDFTDPIVDMLPRLGIDRAVDAVTTVLTAIAGPPGAAAVCILYELNRHPDWKAKLEKEFNAIPEHCFYQAPLSTSPTTYRFVKETLRMWSPPVVMTRFVRTDFDLEENHLKTGQHYLLSPYFIHRDPQNWDQPDQFNPDRWLTDEEAGSPLTKNAYVPFGWAPKACIAANLGTLQLIILCRLMCTTYKLEIFKPEAVYMILDAMPVPVNFNGNITRL